MRLRLHPLRLKALKDGKRFFDLGKPCSKGHKSLRYTKTGECKRCHQIRIKKWKEENKEHVAAYRAKYMDENREYYRHYVRFSESCNRARKKRRFLEKSGTLKFSDSSMTKAEKMRLKHLREAARQYTEWTGVKFEVDHIIPIVDDKVCGLHWSGNWQIIPMRLNRAKRGITTHELAA